MIKGKDINLRAINDEDLKTIHTLRNDLAEVGLYRSPTIHSFHNLKERYMKHGMIQKNHEMLLITDKENRIIGMIQRVKQQSYSTGFEIGFLIYRKSDRKKGYGTEALSLFTSYIFKSHSIERLEIATHVDNIGAQRLAEKCGYQLEGINRKACYIRGVAVDLKRYSILREEVKSLFE